MHKYHDDDLGLQCADGNVGMEKEEREVSKLLTYTEATSIEEANRCISDGWNVVKIFENDGNLTFRMSKEVKEVVIWENNEFGTKDMLINGAKVKPIYDGKYYVSYDGYVYSNLHKEIKKLAFGKFPTRNSKGERTGTYYSSVSLSYNGKEKNYPVHRLVAKAFLENPNNYRCVNHKDGNKLNNCVDNLEWCTNGHNVRHAYKSGLINPYRKGKKCQKCGDRIGDNNKSGYCQKCNRELKKKECPTSTTNTGRAIAQ